MSLRYVYRFFAHQTLVFSGFARFVVLRLPPWLAAFEIKSITILGFRVPPSFLSVNFPDKLFLDFCSFGFLAFCFGHSFHFFVGLDCPLDSFLELFLSSFFSHICLAVTLPCLDLQLFASPLLSFWHPTFSNCSGISSPLLSANVGG